jgi:hypothetical protein
VLDTSDLVNLDTTEDIPQEMQPEMEDKDIEFPSMEEMKAYQDRLSGSSEVDNKDLVSMVCLLSYGCTLLTRRLTPSWNHA